MTNKEAIDRIRQNIGAALFHAAISHDEEVLQDTKLDVEAFKMAIEALKGKAEAIEVKAEQLPPKVPTEWINDGMVLIPKHDWIEMQKKLEKCISAEGGWIPCSERLPGEDESFYVLCCDKYGEIMIGNVFECDEGETPYSAESENEYMYDCVAWMPLPEQYEEQTERSE